MHRFIRESITFSIFLIIAMSMTGCLDTADTAAATAATTAVPRYTVGDIVRSASGSESPAWLVVRYDSAADSYTRALIYKNADGSYGYRSGPATMTMQRAAMEKVYTVKIKHVDVSSVPTAAPTTVTTIETTVTTRTTATSATATATTSAARPSIKDMDPEEGEAGTTVETDITGSDFISNLTAELRHEGESTLKATKVQWFSSSSVTCWFDIPNSTRVGTWDIVLTNPNGQSGEITNYFMIRGNVTGG